MPLLSYKDDDDDWQPLSISYGDDDGIIKQFISNWARFDSTTGLALLGQIDRHSEKDHPYYGLHVLISEKTPANQKKHANSYKLIDGYCLLPLRFELKDVLVIMKVFDEEYQVHNPFDPLRLIFAKKIHSESGLLMHHSQVPAQPGTIARYSTLAGLSWQGIISRMLKEIDEFGDNEEYKARDKSNLLTFFKPQDRKVVNGGRPLPPSYD